MRRPIPLIFAVLGLGAIPRASAPAAEAPAGPVAAEASSTLDTDGGQIRQLAFDGDRETFYASKRPARAGDRFTIRFDRPVALRWAWATTGRPEGAGRLADGALEVSDDGEAFRELARFEAGEARSKGGGREVRAVRIRVDSDAEGPLIVRELAVASDPPVAVFAYPVEFAVDTSEAPELTRWAEDAARTCERAYPMIAEALASDGYSPPRRISLRMKANDRGVAATSGDRITGSARFFKEHPDDVGAMIHETVHVVQHYPGRKSPHWLVEGIADYIRFFKFEPGALGPIDPEKAHYDGSYRVSAAFLGYLVDEYDPRIVRKLNALLREARYDDKVFERLTGKPLRQLDEEWRTTLRH